MWDLTTSKSWADHQVAEPLYYSTTSVWLGEESIDIENMYIVSSVSSVEGHVNPPQSSLQDITVEQSNKFKSTVSHWQLHNYNYVATLLLTLT